MTDGTSLHRAAFVLTLATLLFQIHHSVRAAPAGTIQSRIDNAASGDTVLVQEGVYEENLILRKRVALIGVDNPVVRGNGKGRVVTIDADSCLVSGFTIERSGPMLADEDAGIILFSNHNTVTHNRLADVLFGIYLFGADSNQIADNVVVGRNQLSVGERGSGIHIYNSYHNVFSRNDITEMRDGFYVQYATHTLIEDCEVSRVRYGLHYMYADSNIFLRNSFHDNVSGAAVMYSRGITMRGNTFSHNRGFSSYGILFQDCHGLEADSNVIADNGTGMFFEASTRNSFRHNQIAFNDVALLMFQNSTWNTFTENDFVENLSPLVIIGNQTESFWSSEGRGNYWSSYDGYDLDGDGRGDIPMKIQNVFQYLEGKNPAARLYLYSPASQALALASTTFPVLDRNKEFDPHPLMKPHAPGLQVISDDGASDPGIPSGATWAIVPLAGLLCGGFVFYQLSRKK